MKAVGYIRVSTLEQAEKGESLNIQRAAIKKHIKDNGWEEIKIYSDEGVSGAKNDRPALIDLFEGVQKKEFEIVVIHNLDRFGRSIRDLLNNLEILKNNDVRLVSIQDNIDYSDASGELHLHVLSAVAQFEHRLIKRRLEGGKLVKWRDGRAIVGRLPFGYFFNKEDKAKPKIEVVQKEKDLYLRIVSMYLDEGKSFSDIEEQLKKEGVKCRRKPWSSASISYVLKNSIYYGLYIVNKTKYDGKKRTKEQKPVEEHIPFEIDKPLRFILKTRWDRIQERTQFNKSKGKHITISEDYFLRDVLVCKECGGAIKPRHGNKRHDGSRPRYYGCYWSSTSDKDLKASGRKRCPLPYLKADEVEKEVWDWLIWCLGLQRIEKKGKDKHPFITPFYKLFDSKKYESKLKQFEDQIIELDKEIKNKERFKANLYTLLEKPGDHTEEFLEKLEKVEEQLITLKSKREDVKKNIDNLKEMKDNDVMYRDFLRDSKGFIKKLINDLQKLSPPDRKRLVEGMLIEKIRVWKGREEEKGWEVELSKLRFNKDILTQFMDEGKISYLKKATAHDPS